VSLTYFSSCLCLLFSCETDPRGLIYNKMTTNDKTHLNCPSDALSSGVDVNGTDLRGFVEFLKELVECLDAVVKPKRLRIFAEELSQFQPQLVKFRHLRADVG